MVSIRSSSSASCCWVKKSSRRLTTSTLTSPRVSTMTSTNATVRRPWNVLGMSRRRARSTPASPPAGCSGRRAALTSALGEGVADTADRQDEGRRGRIVLDLLPKVAHVDVDRLLVLVERLVVSQQL